MDLKQGIEILQSNVTFRAILATLLAVGNFLNGAEVSVADLHSHLVLLTYANATTVKRRISQI